MSGRAVPRSDLFRPESEQSERLKATENLAVPTVPTCSDRQHEYKREENGWSASAWRVRRLAAVASGEPAEPLEAIAARIAFYHQASADAFAALQEPDLELDHERAEVAALVDADRWAAMLGHPPAAGEDWAEVDAWMALAPAPAGDGVSRSDGENRLKVMTA